MVFCLQISRATTCCGLETVQTPGEDLGGVEHRLETVQRNAGRPPAPVGEYEEVVGRRGQEALFELRQLHENA